MDNKDLDRLFREKLTGLEQVPPAAAWDKISDGIKKKKPLGIIPIQRYLAVAASLALLFTIGMLISGNEGNKKLVAVQSEKTIDSTEIVKDKAIDTTGYPVEKQETAPKKTQVVPKSYFAQSKPRPVPAPETDENLNDPRTQVVGQMDPIAHRPLTGPETVQPEHQNGIVISVALYSPSVPETVENETVQENPRGIWRKFKKLKKGDNPDFEKLKTGTQRLLAAITNDNEQ